MLVPATTDVTQVVKLETPEIRVWFYPVEGGDDGYEVFKTFEEALKVVGAKTADGKRVYEDTVLIAFRGYELNLWEMKPDPKE